MEAADSGEDGEKARLILWVYGFDVACACDVIYRNVVKSGKNHEIINRYSGFAALVVCISPLADMQQVCNLLKPPCTKRYAQWCERTVANHRLLLDWII